MKFFNFSLQLFITFKWFFSSTAFLSNKHDLKSWDAHYSPGLLITSFSFCLSYSPSNRGNRFEPWDFMKHGLFNIHTFIDRFAIILCMLTVTLILVMTRFQWLLESPGATHFYSFSFFPVIPFVAFWALYRYLLHITPLLFCISWSSFFYLPTLSHKEMV